MSARRHTETEQAGETAEDFSPLGFPVKEWRGEEDGAGGGKLTQIY